MALAGAPGSGVIWLVSWLARIRQARLARGFAGGGPTPAAYCRDGRRRLFWGIVTILMLAAAMRVTAPKP